MNDYVVMPKADWQNILGSTKRKAGTSTTIKSGELPSIIDGISTGSSSSFETAEVYLYCPTEYTVYYTALVDGELVSASLSDVSDYIYPVVGTYIFLEKVVGTEDGNNVLMGEDYYSNETTVYGYKRFKVINRGAETIYMMELPESESGGSSVERLNGYLSLSTDNEDLTTVYITYGYYDETGSFICENLTHSYGAFTKIENPVKGALVILCGGAYGQIGWDGVEQVDSGGTVFRITGQDSDNPVINILGKNDSSDPLENVSVGLLNYSSTDFYVDYVAYSDIDGTNTFYPIAIRKTAGGGAIMVAKDSVFKVVGVEYCYIDYGNLVILSEVTEDGKKCSYVKASGAGDIMI